MADINFHPFKNRGAFGGLFNVESRGLMQGMRRMIRQFVCNFAPVDWTAKSLNRYGVALELWSALLPRKTALTAR
ncbi:hypothetical protein SE955_13370 [Escherichia coli]|nr:hypothetical protein [Escherichia coli]